jgi:hypothetical protein
MKALMKFFLCYLYDHFQVQNAKAGIQGGDILPELFHLVAIRFFACGSNLELNLFL